MEIKNLIDAGVRQSGELFCVADIKAKFPTFKVNTDKIKEVDFNGFKLAGIRFKDIAKMDSFDKMLGTAISNK